MSTSADVVRRFNQAVAAADLTLAGECFTPDAVWHLPGDSAISGDHVGWPAIRDDFLGKLGPLSGGTFRARPRDGLIHEVRGHYSDEASLNSFWQHG